MIFRKYLVILSALLAMLPAVSAAGSMSDYQALKSWCVGRNNWDAAGRKTAYPTPKNYFHYHHYCAAMKWMETAYKKSNKVDKRFALGNVQNNLDYVVSHVPADHFLMPEVYSFKGTAHVLEGNKVKAESDLYRALQLDPGHVDAITALARLYRDSNRTDKAKVLVKNGLAVAPDNKSLLRLAEQLGIPDEEIKAVVDAADKKVEPVAENVPLQQSAATEAAVTNEVDQAAAPVRVETAIQPKVGSPTNPYCRFCPD